MIGLFVLSLTGKFWVFVQEPHNIPQPGANEHKDKPNPGNVDNGPAD